MSRIKTENIKGYQVDEEMVCNECIEGHEATAAKLSDIILSEDIEKDDETRFFCNRCEEQL
jgi:hypothetical protein